MAKRLSAYALNRVFIAAHVPAQVDSTGKVFKNPYSDHEPVKQKRQPRREGERNSKVRIYKPNKEGDVFLKENGMLAGVSGIDSGSNHIVEIEGINSEETYFDRLVNNKWNEAELENVCDIYFRCLMEEINCGEKLPIQEIVNRIVDENNLHLPVRTHIFLMGNISYLNISRNAPVLKDIPIIKPIIEEVSLLLDEIIDENFQEYDLLNFINVKNSNIIDGIDENKNVKSKEDGIQISKRIARTTRTITSRSGKSVFVKYKVKWLDIAQLDQFVGELLVKQNYRCAQTGIEFNESSHWYHASLDRIDSNGHYSKNNVQLVTWFYNKIKGTNTDADVKKMLIDHAMNLIKK
ncbi:MAG: hypothetical protein G8345_07805 [Magnetococcales bacterium]|nr:hypothetical protein [Magnetococcales bacterium]